MSTGNKIGITTATIIGMNAMIGAGIFGIPVALAANVGPAGIVTTMFVAIAVWFMAISLARVAALFPEEGSFYIYSKQWGGHNLGIFTSTAYLVGLVIAMGLLTQMAGYNLQHYFPNTAAPTLGLIVLIALVILNLFGVILSEIGQQILICTTVFPLLASIVICLGKTNLSNLTPFAPHGWLNVLKASKTVIFSFFGFECAASLFAIVKDPQKNVPKALAYAITIVSVLYILFTAAIIVSIPLSTFTSATMPISTVLKLAFPDLTWPIEAIHLSVLSAIIGTIHSMMWSSSNLLVSLIKELKNKTAQKLIKQNFITPRISILLVGLAIYASFATLKNIDLFFSLTAICIVFAYASSIVTLLTIPKEWESGQNIKTLIGLGTAITIFIFAIEGLISALT
jgi:amino acid efflux transporter